MLLDPAGELQRRWRLNTGLMAALGKTWRVAFVATNLRQLSVDQIVIDKAPTTARVPRCPSLKLPLRPGCVLYWTRCLLR